MGDLFQDKGIKPMLISAEGEAFDSHDYLYALKLDGERCLSIWMKVGQICGINGIG